MYISGLCSHKVVHQVTYVRSWKPLQVKHVRNLKFWHMLLSAPKIAVNNFHGWWQQHT